MITLYGFPVSNYYNKVKMALLEKGVAFEESYAGTKSKDESVLGASPLGKIPFIRTPEGGLCESQVILDYIEELHPQPPLLPAGAYERAKVRELITFIDWHIEIAARRLYAQAFFGGAALSGGELTAIRAELEKQIAAFRKLAKFSPYVAGDTFTMADCSAFNNLPVVAMATKAVYGEDLLAAGGIDHRAYVKFVGERPSAQRVVADRKAATAKR